MKPIDIAASLKISYTLVEYWVEEKRAISQNQHTSLSNILDCDLSWLNFGDNADNVKRNALQILQQRRPVDLTKHHVTPLSSRLLN